MIKFSELSVLLKLAAIGGILFIIWLVLIIAAFVLGFVGGVI